MLNYEPWTIPVHKYQCLLKSLEDIDLIAEQRRGTLSSSTNQHSTHERDDSR